MTRCKVIAAKDVAQRFSIDEHGLPYIPGAVPWHEIRPTLLRDGTYAIDLPALNAEAHAGAKVALSALTEKDVAENEWPGTDIDSR